MQLHRCALARRPKARRSEAHFEAEQCAVFALVKSGFFLTPPLSEKSLACRWPSVSHLANCTARAAGKIWHYPQVESEWRSTSAADEFIRTYLTEDIFLARRSG